MPKWYLKKTLTTKGNTFGFSGTDITFDFDPTLTKVQERVSKKYAGDIQRPRSNATINNFASSNILIDLKQIKWEWTITGVLTNDSGNISGVSPSTTSTAANKKNLLIAFGEQGKTMSWVERNSSEIYSVNVISMVWDDVETEVNAYSGVAESAMKTNEQRIKFTIILRKGIDRGA